LIQTIEELLYDTKLRIIFACIYMYMHVAIPAYIIDSLNKIFDYLYFESRQLSTCI